MKIKHSDIIPEADNPFGLCKLERKKYAELLTSIVETYAEGFVLAINNAWGTGKTTFVRMWEQQLKNKKYKTIYFNAWENDFESNPLVAIMAELQVLKEPKNEEAFKTLIKKGAVLSKSLIPLLIKAIAAKYIDNKLLVESIEELSKGATEILTDEMKEYGCKKQGLKDFRDEMKEFIKKTSAEKPIVFIIDELDRCRPNYAVEVLEQVKHFFSVPGIVFVLSIDKTQLGHAIRGVYGSEQINTEEYLRRFIDIEYSIPVSNTAIFCEYLFDYFQFDDFLRSEERKKYSLLNQDSSTLRSLAIVLFEKHNLTLRQQEKILAHSRIVLNSFEANDYIFPNLFLFLVFIKTLVNDLYIKIERKTISLQQLADYFFEVISPCISEDVRNGLLYLQAELLITYDNYIRSYRSEKLILKNRESGEEYTIVNSKLDVSENNERFWITLKQFAGDYNKSGISIDRLLNKINLVDNVVS